jgi:hypothetical protein
VARWLDEKGMADRRKGERGEKNVRVFISKGCACCDANGDVTIHDLYESA